MKKIAVLTLCLIGAALTIPTGAVAQCTTGTVNSQSDGALFVGQIPGAGDIAAGQQFTVDCESQLLSVSFELNLDQSSMGAVACLASGDTVACKLMDTSFNELLRVEQIVDWSRGTADVTFDFSPHTWALQADTDYIVAWEMVTKGYAFMQKNSDTHSGHLVTATDGVWTDDWFGDAVFSVSWDENGVPNEELSWGAFKSDYR